MQGSKLWSPWLSSKCSSPLMCAQPPVDCLIMGVPVVCSELVKCVLCDWHPSLFRFFRDWGIFHFYTSFCLSDHQWMDVCVVAKKFVWMRAFIGIRCLIRRGFAESYGNYLKRCCIGSEDTAVFHCQAPSFSSSPAILIMFLFKI